MARKRFIWHIFPAFLLITLLSVLLVSYGATRAVDEMQLRRARSNLAARAALLRALITRPSLHGDVSRLQELSEALGAETETRITIVAPDGRVLVDSRERPEQMDNHANRPEIAAARNGMPGEAIRFSYTLNRRMLYLAMPESDRPGARILRVALPLDAIKETAGAIYRRLGYIVAAVSLLAALASWAVSRRIVKPIAALKNGAERFAQGQLDTPMPVPQSEEIASLADAMNQMAAQLAERIRTMEHQRNEQDAVFSSMIESVVAVDTELRVISINPAAVALLNVGPRNVKNRPILEIVRNTALHDFARDALQSTGVMESELTLDHGDRRHVKAHGTVLRNGMGEAMGAVIVLHDITRLRRLEKVRQDFVANVSHELKTPITAIKGFIETLLDESEPSPTNTRRFLQIIEKQANRLNAIIDDLLTLSRLEVGNGSSDFQFEESRVLEVLESAAELCQHQAEARKITIEVQCPADLTAAVNPPLLEQGVLNLINNAIKYSEDGQQVIVRASRDQSNLTIAVIDSGAGIPAGEQERIFERFYRVDRARSRQRGGTGLGLSIVKHIAQVHHGHISVSSAPGEGSTFRLTLPLE